MAKRIIMSMLEMAPMTGDEIAQNLSTSVVPFWSAVASQIKSMKENNLVETETVSGGEKMNVEQYTLTCERCRKMFSFIDHQTRLIKYR